MNLVRVLFTLSLLFCIPESFALGCNTCTNGEPCVNPCPPPEKPIYTPCPDCCEGMGGVQYCDKTAGRFVCANGSYSTCYCDRHAVMDLQKIEGCCLWKGGVMAIDEAGIVVCNNGGISEECSDLTVLERHHKTW